jgi:hypothetical protein
MKERIQDRDEEEDRDEKEVPEANPAVKREPRDGGRAQKRANGGSIEIYGSYLELDVCSRVSGIKIVHCRDKTTKLKLKKKIKIN